VCDFSQTLFHLALLFASSYWSFFSSSETGFLPIGIAAFTLQPKEASSQFQQTGYF
jgi:hypothetical protein